jgi:hypothetical protein
MRATINAYRVCELINKQEYFYCDDRQIETVAKAIWGVDFDNQALSMVHNEADYLIDDKGQALPEQGHNNDGCTLVLLEHDKKLDKIQAKVCMFWPYDLKRQTPSAYLKNYYDLKTQNSPDFQESYKSYFQFMSDNPIKLISAKEFEAIFNEGGNSEKTA